MTAPGELDEDGWRIPKKPRALAVYHLAKQGLGPSAIAKLTGLKSASVRVMTHRIRNPKQTPCGCFYYAQPKTVKRQHDFSGKYIDKGRRYRESKPLHEREQIAYNGSRYA